MLSAGPQGGGCAGRVVPRAGLEEHSQRGLRGQPRAQNLAEEPVCGEGVVGAVPPGAQRQRVFGEGRRVKQEQDVEPARAVR